MHPQPHPDLNPHGHFHLHIGHRHPLPHHHLNPSDQDYNQQDNYPWGPSPHLYPGHYHSNPHSQQYHHDQNQEIPHPHGHCNYYPFHHISPWHHDEQQGHRDHSPLYLSHHHDRYLPHNTQTHSKAHSVDNQSLTNTHNIPVFL